MTAPYPIEHRWELGGGFLCRTAKWVQEISNKGGSLADEMAPIEMVGRTFPWTFSCLTRRGRERRMRRWEGEHGFWGERVEVPA